MNATEDDVPRYYDLAGPAYIRLMQQVWHHGFPDAEDRGLDYAQTAKELAEHLVTQAGLRPEHWAIEFGAGVGGGTCHMASVSDSSWVGVSNNDWLSEQARAYATEQGLGERVHFLGIGDTDYKTFAAWPDGSFQLFVFAESICHLPDKQALFHAAYRILAPGGVLAGIDWLKRPYGQYRTDEQIMRFMAPVERWFCIPHHGTVDSYRRMIENAGFRVRTAGDMWVGRKCWGSTPPDDGQGWYDYDGPQAEMFHHGKKALMDAKESGVFTVGLFIADKPSR